MRRSKGKKEEDPRCKLDHGRVKLVGEALKTGEITIMIEKRAVMRRRIPIATSERMRGQHCFCGLLKTDDKITPGKSGRMNTIYPASISLIIGCAEVRFFKCFFGWS